MAVQYFTATSLDGFIADPNHSLEWLLQFGTEDPSYPEFIRDVGVIAMGSSTYEWLWRHHLAPDAPAPMPWFYAQPCWVFSSRTLPVVEGADIRFVRGDVRPVFDAMQETLRERHAAGQTAPNIWIVGGGDLAGQFHDAGLLDEMIVTITSVTLGQGAPLFPRRVATPALALKAVRQVGPEFVQLTYQVPKS